MVGTGGRVGPSCGTEDFSAPGGELLHRRVGALAGVDPHHHGEAGPQQALAGDILGHEPMGIVEEVGSGTGDLRVGQPIEAVVVPASAEAITGRPTTYEGIVSSVDMSDDGQTKLVDVQVRTDDASPLAAAAARQEVAIVVKSKGNGSGDTAAEPSDSTSDTTPSASPTS